MNDMKQFEKFAEMMQSMMPKVKANKNGYELRTKVLEFAQTQAWQDFNARWGAFEISVVKDKNTGEIVTSGQMPQVPGVDTVLETAQKFYEFVSNGSQKKE